MDPGELDDCVRVLDDDGRVIDDALEPDLDDAVLLRMYGEMRLARRFDERAVALQRSGRLGTYPPLAGQEASQVGSAHALAPEDWVAYQYREHAVPMVRGIDPAHLLRYWMGREEGNAALADANVFPIDISIGSQIPHAVGLGWAAKLRGDDAVAVCHFGDGATSEGDFHEALNFAGVFDVPVVFVCHNNGWAISIPRERQTASETIAGKADAYGFEGVRVDGMDPLAVYHVAREALRRARDEGTSDPRPILIEAVEYRFGAHTTADDPERYREEAAVEAWRELDPIPRFESYLRDHGLLDDGRIEEIESRIGETIETAIERAVGEDADPDGMFEHVYAEPTRRIEEDRARLRDLRERHGDDALRD